MAPKKILISIRPDDLHLVAAALGDEFSTIVCHTLKDARSHLSSELGLIACGVHFDGGAMFDLLRAAKSDPSTKDVPFFVLIGQASGHSESVLSGIRTAARLLGAEGFTDLTRLQADLGQQAAYQRIRAIVRQVLASPGSAAAG